MRTNLILSIVIALSLILCPIFALGSGNKDAVAETVQTDSVTVADVKETNYISVMSSLTGDISKIEMREYVIGSVAAEMSPLYHTEALKAQAVASYTYAKKVREQNGIGKKTDLGNADITDSPDVHQGYIDEKARREKWGEKFEEYENKIEAAVDAVFGSYMTYEGETVLAVYHSNSAGSTQSAESLWGTEIPYIVSVESPGDKLSPDYISKTVFTPNEFKSYAKKCSVKLTGDADDWVEDIITDKSGYVTSVMLCGEKVSATKFRKAFSLRSHCFDIEYDGEEFTVTCRGYGHGAGMSQYGADYMARQGSTWQEILMHYYTGIEVATG